MSYEIMRVFAGSWGLVFMFVAFAVIVFVTLRPGSRNLHRDIADIPFRHEGRPAAAEASEAQK
ncbi:MAG: cbb3-type cytochrome c oxidase subunit 3 [Pseudomonadota bacterium]